MSKFRSALLSALISTSFLLASSMAVMDEDFGRMVVRASAIALFFSLVCAFALVGDVPTMVERPDDKEVESVTTRLDRVVDRLSVSNGHMCRAIDLLEATKRELRLTRGVRLGEVDE